MTPELMQKMVDALQAADIEASHNGVWDSHSAQYDWGTLARAALAVAAGWVREHPYDACDGTRGDCANLAESMAP